MPKAGDRLKSTGSDRYPYINPPGKQAGHDAALFNLLTAANLHVNIVVNRLKIEGDWVW